MICQNTYLYVCILHVQAQEPLFVIILDIQSDSCLIACSLDINMHNSVMAAKHSCHRLEMVKLHLHFQYVPTTGVNSQRPHCAIMLIGRKKCLVNVGSLKFCCCLGLGPTEGLLGRGGENNFTSGLGATLERPGTEQRAGGREAMTVLRPKQAISAGAEPSMPVVPVLPLSVEPQIQQKGLTSQQRRVSKVLGAKVVSSQDFTVDV